MKAYTPEISWHNRLPALSLDISPPSDDSKKTYRIATGGNDCRVYIWIINLVDANKPDIRIRAGLRRHQKSVGAVRFSSQHILASGDDDGYIYLWKHKLEEQQDYQISDFLNEDGFEDLEVWHNFRVLRGHIEDICDLAWSKDGQYLFSGSVDNSAILWDTTKGCKIWCSDLIKGYVQGVAIDPHSQFLAALSSDRTLRIYNFSDKRLISATRRMSIKNEHKAIFCDDTVQTFCRRFEFSPDGQYMITPTSRLIAREPKRLEKVDVIILDGDDEQEDQEPPKEPEPPKDPEPPAPKKKPTNVILVFKRTNLKNPVCYYPTGREVALCIRFSPIAYKLRNNETNFWGAPYRIVFAVATSRSVLIYDSQQTTPIAYASQIHLARLTDLSWSSDGLLLMISSYDGYSTLITFENNEFGERYYGPLIEPVEEVNNDEVDQPNKGKKRTKGPKEGTKKEKLSIQNDEDDEDEQCGEQRETKALKKATPRKIVPTRLPESSTIFKYLIKKN